MTNENGGSPSSNSFSQPIVALFILFTGQRHPCIKDVVHILVLAQLMI
jgi:hypothetical protein